MIMSIYAEWQIKRGIIYSIIEPLSHVEPVT
jgi:hypothetical protein